MGSFKNHTQNLHPLIFQIRNTFHIFSNIPLHLNFSPNTQNKKGHPAPSSHLRFPNPCSGIKISELPISDNLCWVCDQKQKNNITMPIQHTYCTFSDVQNATMHRKTVTKKEWCLNSSVPECDQLKARSLRQTPLHNV